MLLLLSHVLMSMMLLGPALAGQLVSASVTSRVPITIPGSILTHTVATPTSATKPPSSLKNVACPDEAGAGYFACADPWCGGSDPNNAGRCKSTGVSGVACNCYPTPAGPSLYTVLIQTVGDKTVEASYVAAIHPSYTGLREQATVTAYVSQPPAPDGNPKVEQVWANVFSGGYIWILYAMSELGVLDPLPPQDGFENDATNCDILSQPAWWGSRGSICHYPECAGAFSGFCTNASDHQHFGCLCRVPVCPDQVDCADPDCGGVGNDNVCSEISIYEGCTCANGPCPNVDAPLPCDDPQCGGFDQPWVCRGVLSPNGTIVNKGCGCSVGDNPEPNIGPDNGTEPEEDPDEPEDPETNSTAGRFARKLSFATKLWD